jgi:hypothetical protein
MALQTRLERGASGEFREVVPDLVHFAVAPYVSAQAAEQEMRWARRDCAAMADGADRRMGNSHPLSADA